LASVNKLLLNPLETKEIVFKVPPISDLLDKADSDLFRSMRRSDHCLHHVLPPLRTVDNLKVRGHPYNLPECSTVAVTVSVALKDLAASAMTNRSSDLEL